MALSVAVCGLGSCSAGSIVFVCAVSAVVSGSHD